jgi:glycosyltransferase involved in cell wall biosynthesis
MGKEMTTTLLIPILNEIGGMKVIMPLIDPKWVDQILILDGGSTDGSIEYAQKNGYEIIIQEKPGLRHAYVQAMNHIRGDVIITFSPDGNSIPELIPPLIEKMKEGYDMVIVSRYADGAKSYDDSLVTAFGNWLFTTVINVLHRANYTDSLVIFRAYKKNMVWDLDLDKDDAYKMPEKMFRTLLSWEPLLSVRCAKRKLKYADIPGDEPARISGERKLQVLRWGAAYMTQILLETFFWGKPALKD